MFTLKDFLNLDIMSDAEVLNDSLNKEAYLLNYISVQEPPVEGFIRENEMVLSTAVGLEENISLLNFVEAIHQAKASALVLTLNPQTDQQICQAVVDYANANQFPVIEIPWEVRFSDIIEVVMEVFQKQENEQEEKYISLQKELLHTYFNGDSLEKAAEIIAKKTDYSIIILDKDRETKGSCILEEELNFREVRIEVSDYLYGYLKVAKYPSDREDSVNLSFFYFYINVPLSLWFEKEEVVNTTSLNLRNDFVWQLANEEHTPKKLLSQGVQLGFDMDLLYFCVLFQIHEENQSGSYTDSFLAIESRIISLIKEQNLRTMISLKENTFIIFLEYKPEFNLSSLLNKIEEDILKVYPDYSFTWGIGEEPQLKYNFYDQYRKAQIALEQALYLQVPRLNYKKSRISSIVHQVTTREDIKEQAQNLFAPIESNDRFNEIGMDLIHTITIYIKLNYNTSQTARHLNIHRQSLLYRLEKFEELTELSLDDSDDLFLTQYYLRLLGRFQYE